MQSTRTRESVRAETSFQHWTNEPPSQRPLWRHRGFIADTLGVVLKDHGISKNRFALMLRVDKKQVRRMLGCDTPIHIDVLFALPDEVAVDFMRRLRGTSSSLAEQIDRLDLEGAIEAQRRVTDRIACLATVSR